MIADLKMDYNATVGDIGVQLFVIIFGRKQVD